MDEKELDEVYAKHRSTINQVRYAMDKDRRLARQKEYYKANREARLAYQKKWKEEHEELAAAHHKQYVEAHAKKIAKYQHEYWLKRKAKKHGWTE